MAWTTLTFGFASNLTSTQMTQLYDNFISLAEGGSGAPIIKVDAMGIPSTATTTIPSGAAATFSKGFFMAVAGNGAAGDLIIEIFDSITWFGVDKGVNGLFYSDGVNVRIRNTGGGSVTLEYFELGA